MYETARPVAVVSVLDPALDLRAMGRTILEYERSRDPSLIREKAGASAARFEVGPIPTSIFTNYVRAATTDAEIYRRAFQVSVKKVTDMVDRNGRKHPVVQPSGKMATPTGDLSYWDEEQMELIWPGLAEEIGSVAFSWSFLGRSTGGSLPVLQSLHTDLILRIYRDAAEILKDVADSKRKRAPASAKQSASDGEAPTAATATGKATKTRSRRKTSSSKGKKTSSST